MARHSFPGSAAEVRPITAIESGTADWAGAVWVGQIDESDLVGSRLRIVDGEEYGHVRLLVWSGDQPRGFVEAPLAVDDGTIDVVEVVAQVAELPEVSPRAEDWPRPPISVVVCTRDRPDRLRDVLSSIVELDYPEFEVLVVDNNPDSGLTPPIVAEFDDVPVRLAEAPGQGLSVARNVGITHAAYGIIAFTDDDVLVHRHWLTNLSYGFARDDRVACVCGMVPSAEVNNRAQSYFDRRVGWARRCEPAVYELAAPPPDDPLFPMRVAQFGTGANFALRRDVAIELGGFDEGMGIGSPTGGGEDIDVFVRVLLAGHILVREPAAVVWHRHRRTVEELELQVTNYGVGLGAWISKLAARPRTLAMVLRRMVPAVRHLRHLTRVQQEDPAGVDPALDVLYRRELSGVFDGPVQLLQARFQGRRARPLRPARGMRRLVDFGGRQMWGDPGNTVLAGRFSLAAVVFGLIGALGLLRMLPMPVLAIAVLLFAAVGPGSLVMSWYSRLPTFALIPLTCSVSVALCVLVVGGLLMLEVYDPLAVLAGMVGATVVGGLLRCGYLVWRNGSRAS